MNQNFFDLHKDDGMIGSNDWVREIPFVSYGYITEVLTDSLVIVSPVIQGGLTKADIYVPLLASTSSALEINVTPRVDDLVLLFSLNGMNSMMFNPPWQRRDEEADPPVTPELPATGRGYTWSTMVGILASTVKQLSDVVVNIGGTRTEDEDSTACAVTVGSNTFSLSVAQNAAVQFGSGADEEDYRLALIVLPKHSTFVDLESPVNLELGYKDEVKDDKYIRTPVEAPIDVKHSHLSPLTERTGAARTMLRGYDHNEDGEVEPTDAADSVTYSEKAPVMRKYGANVTRNFGFDADDEPIETTVEDTYSEKAEKKTTHDAPVTITLGEKGTVDITGKNFSLSLDGDGKSFSCSLDKVSIETDGTELHIKANNAKADSDGSGWVFDANGKKIELTSSKCTILGNLDVSP